MRWPWQSPKEPIWPALSPQQRRDDAAMDRFIEAAERSVIPCVMCEIGEPHACERAWWQQRDAHLNFRECADPDCLCHPTTCGACGQSISRAALLARGVAS